MKLSNKKILVAGAGLSGISAVNLLCETERTKVALYDGNENLDREKLLAKFKYPDEVELILGDLKEEDLKNIDLMVISPGISLEKPFVKLVESKNIPIWSEIELAYVLSKGKIIAITGTNGKTTTTALVGEIMKEYFRSVFVVGNIGIPYTEIALKTKDYSIIVAEISSFQLETIHNFKPKVSAILNLTPDHLDRHKTMENYADVKQRIAINQTEKGTCVLNYDDETTREMADKINAKISFFSRLENLENGVCLNENDIVIRKDNEEIKVCSLNNLKLLGNHNVENVMAGIAIANAMNVPVEVIIEGVTNFKGVEHRIEYVDTIDGVDYYNDSKGTNPDAAIKGIKAMTKPTLLIGGGYDKGVSFDEWIKAFDNKVKYLVLIGQTANVISDTAKKYGFNNIIFADSLEQAIDICREKSEDGDAVLLSPACASWGMFKNYEERGRIFKEYIHNLKR